MKTQKNVPTLLLGDDIYTFNTWFKKKFKKSFEDYTQDLIDRKIVKVLWLDRTVYISVYFYVEMTFYDCSASIFSNLNTLLSLHLKRDIHGWLCDQSVTNFV